MKLGSSAKSAPGSSVEESDLPSAGRKAGRPTAGPMGAATGVAAALRTEVTSAAGTRRSRTGGASHHDAAGR